MRILAIETSCDETAVAIVEDGTIIISNVVASSKELHAKTGGIIPEIAAREQVRCMIPVLEEALKKFKVQSSKFKVKKLNKIELFKGIEAIAVTVGPGLIGSLLIGVETAKTMSYVLNLPLIPVNHVLAHIYANFIGSTLIVFPAVALVVSGGHSELFFMKSESHIKWISGTLDDAAGEAFDKTARILGLGFPGGPAIAARAAKLQIPNSKFQIKLPRPMIKEKNFDFSFSGLKTAVMREVENLKNKRLWNEDMMSYFANEIQEAITDVLVDKTLKAAEMYKVKSILLGGGVAANKRLMEKMKLEIGNWKLEINLHVPPPSLCTDNAVYIASFAYFQRNFMSWREVQAQPGLSVEV